MRIEIADVDFDGVALFRLIRCWLVGWLVESRIQSKEKERMKKKHENENKDFFPAQ